MAGEILPLLRKQLSDVAVALNIISFVTPNAFIKSKNPVADGANEFIANSKAIVRLNKSPTARYPTLPEGCSDAESAALVTSAEPVGI